MEPAGIPDHPSAYRFSRAMLKACSEGTMSGSEKRSASSRSSVFAHTWSDFCSVCLVLLESSPQWQVEVNDGAEWSPGPGLTVFVYSGLVMSPLLLEFFMHLPACLAYLSFGVALLKGQARRGKLGSLGCRLTRNRRGREAHAFAHLLSGFIYFSEQKVMEHR